MKKTLLLVGNSHSACRYEAADTFHAAGIAPESVSWICQGGNVTPFVVDAKARTIRPNFASLRSAIIQVYIKKGVRVVDGLEEDPGLPFDAIDAIVLSSAGVRPPEVLMAEHICHYMSQVPTSDALVKAWVGGRSISRIMPKLLALRQAGFAGRILVTPWIRPFSLPEFCTPEIWERYCRLEQETLRSTLAEVQATLLPYPAGTESTTDIELTTRKPGVHGNSLYGALINRLLLDVAYPEVAEKNQRQAA